MGNTSYSIEKFYGEHDSAINGRTEIIVVRVNNGYRYVGFSPDGRFFIAFNHENGMKSIVYSFQSGTETFLPEELESSQYPDFNWFQPNGRHIVQKKQDRLLFYIISNKVCAAPPSTFCQVYSWGEHQQTVPVWEF